MRMRTVDIVGTLRSALAGGLVAALLAPPAAWANPSGAQVVNGDVSIQQSGATTTIRASDQSIINYQSFSIAPNETVQFVQPGAQARVLNRVTGVDASQIDGALLANGQVYLVNPAGVFFGGEAVVDVGRLVAVAGSIRDEDFLAGSDRFDLTGAVENRGTITAADGVALAGTRVANLGKLAARDGAILLVAGQDVYLGEHGSHVLVKVSGPARMEGDQAAVANDGLVDAGAGSVRLAAGDAMGLAVRNTGEIRGHDVALDGGPGEVRVAGRIDASDATAGATGGRIEVRGDRVLVDGAALDASGDAGGGTILVGGDAHGAGEGRNASETIVTADSSLRADALRQGDGGTVVAWADGVTGVYGDVSARGGEEGGDGGFVETSGKRYLDAGTTPDVSAPQGKGGTWLLDPADITVVAGSGSLDSRPLVFGQLFVQSPVGSSTIGAQRIIDALESGTNVVISTFIDPNQSDPGLGDGFAGDITVNAPIQVTRASGDPQTDVSLQMGAARHVIVNAPIEVVNAVGDAVTAADDVPLRLNVVLIADEVTQADQGGGDGVGDVVVNAPIVTNGGSFQSGFSADPLGGTTVSSQNFFLNADAAATPTRIDAGQGAVRIAHNGDVRIERDVSAGGGIQLEAGRDGSGSLTLGVDPSVPDVRLSGGSLILIAGDDIGGAGSGAAVQLGDATAGKRVALDLVPFDPDGDGTPERIVLSLRQDADLDESAFDALDVTGAAPDRVTLISSDGNLEIADPSRLVAATDEVFLEGETVSLAGPISAPNIEVRSHNGLTLGTGPDELDVANLMAGDTLTIAAGSTGTGNLTVSNGVQFGSAADRLAELELRAGDGVGGAGSAATVELDTGTPPVFHVTDRVLIRQDAGIEDADVPDVSQYDSGRPEGFPLEIELRSDDGDVTLMQASTLPKLGAAVTTGTAHGPDDVDVVLTSSKTVTLPTVNEAAGEWIDFGDDLFTWKSPLALVATTALNRVRSDQLRLQGGAEQAGLGLSFQAPGTNNDIVHLNAREIWLQAGDGVGGVGGGAVNARGDTITSGRPLFFGRDGTGAPETLVFEQDAALVESQLATSFPTWEQFGNQGGAMSNLGGPTDSLFVRTNDGGLVSQVVQSPALIEQATQSGLVVRDLDLFSFASDSTGGNVADTFAKIVLSGPSVSFEPDAGDALDLTGLPQPVEVRTDLLRFLAFDATGSSNNLVPGTIDASSGLTLAAFDPDFSLGSRATPATSPGRVHFQQDGDLSTAALPAATDFVAGLNGVDYSLLSRRGGDIDLGPDASRVNASDLTVTVRSGPDPSDTTRTRTGSIFFTDLTLSSLAALAAGDLVVGDKADQPVQIVATNAIDLQSGSSGTGDLGFAAGTGGLLFASRVGLFAGVGATTTSSVNASNAPQIAAPEVIIAQDAALVDTANVPDPSRFQIAPATLRLASRRDSVTLTDPAQLPDPTLLEILSDDVHFALAPGASVGAWDFASQFQGLSVQGLGGDGTSPGTLTVSQPGPIAGANLPDPAQLGGGPGGVVYRVESSAGDVVVDTEAARRLAGSRANLLPGTASGGIARFASDDALALTSLDVVGPALLERDTDVSALRTSFSSTIDGAFALDLGGYESAWFGGDLGGTTPLASLTLDAPGGTTSFAGASRVVTQGDILLDPAGRAGVPGVATLGKPSGDLLLQSLGGRVAMGQNEKLSVAGRLEISAPGSVQLGDVSALALRVTSPDIRILRRAPGQVQTAGGALLRDAGVDIVANTIDFSSVPVATGTGADPVFGVTDPTSLPVFLSGFAVAGNTPDGRPLTAGDLASGGVLLDRRTEGPGLTNPADSYPARLPALAAARPNPVVLASLVGAAEVGVEPREPSDSELLAAARGVVIYDDVERGRGYALLDQAVSEVSPGAGASAAAAEGSAAETGLPAPPVPVTERRLEPDVVDEAAELYQEVFGSNGENAPRIRSTLAKAIEDYRRDTGARRVYGFELRRYIRNRPSSQYEAYRTLRELDLLFRVHRRSGLAPGEYERIQQGWLRQIQPEGISVDELGEAIHPSGRRRSGDILDIFGE